MNHIVSKLLANTKKAWLSLGVALLTCAAVGSLGAGTAQALDGIRIRSIYQNGNNVVVTYSVPNNTPGFSQVQTRWGGSGAGSINEHQQTLQVGNGNLLTYTIPNVQFNQRYVFRVRGYARTWHLWHFRHFNTKGVTYRGYLYQGQ